MADGNKIHCGIVAYTWITNVTPISVSGGNPAKYTAAWMSATKGKCFTPNKRALTHGADRQSCAKRRGRKCKTAMPCRYFGTLAFVYHRGVRNVRRKMLNDVAGLFGCTGTSTASSLSSIGVPGMPLG